MPFALARSYRTWGLVLALSLLACGGQGRPAPGQGIVLDDHCPGRDHCDDGSGPLQVGVGRADVTPRVTESEWTDVDGDGLYDADEPFVDTNGNGTFDAVWLAGFSPGRAADNVASPLEARAMALSQGDTLVVIVYVDVVGLLRGDIERIRDDERLAALGIDKLVVGATHNHQGPDTIGVWSPGARSEDIVTRVVNGAAEAAAAAVAGLAPSRMSWASSATVDSLGSTLRYVSDTRDPVIYDPTLTVLAFHAATGDQIIGHLVGWAAHAEYAGSLNRQVSPDFVHWLRYGVDRAAGGLTVFMQGALGGQVGPGDASPLGAGGEPIAQPSLAKAEAAGSEVAKLVLDASRKAKRVTSPKLAYRTATFEARIDNVVFHAETAFPHARKQYAADEAEGPATSPWLESRVTLVQLGPVAFVTAPGALHPELWVGGYDGSWSWGNPLINENVNVPDLSLAPEGPYLRDLMYGLGGVEHAFVAGLAEDYLGYIVAGFDFVLSDDPYVTKAEGDHYEETRSLGPQSDAHIHERMVDLVKARP